MGYDESMNEIKVVMKNRSSYNHSFVSLQIAAEQMNKQYIQVHYFMFFFANEAPVLFQSHTKAINFP